MAEPTPARILVTSPLFGKADGSALEVLDATGGDITVVDTVRPLTEEEISERIAGVRAIVAGMEPHIPRVLDKATDLKLIARVGVGYDSVDVEAARARGIEVTHTPDGPWPGVTELTIGLMIDLLRGVGRSDRALRAGKWSRPIGRRLAEATVGIIGVGRIGKGVVRHLTGGFPGARILANDLAPDEAFGAERGITWTDKETIYREADLITLHVPLTRLTRGLITAEALAMMKPEACLLNTARGGMIDEVALAAALREGRLAGAALDVFEREPYAGPLTEIDTCVLIPHIGGNTFDCRHRMEMGAAEEVRRLLAGEPPAFPVPDEA